MDIVGTKSVFYCLSEDSEGHIFISLWSSSLAVRSCCITYVGKAHLGGSFFSHFSVPKACIAYHLFKFASIHVGRCKKALFKLYWMSSFSFHTSLIFIFFFAILIPLIFSKKKMRHLRQDTLECFSISWWCLLVKLLYLRLPISPTLFIGRYCSFTWTAPGKQKLIYLFSACIILHYQLASLNAWVTCLVRCSISCTVQSFRNVVE